MSVRIKAFDVNTRKNGPLGNPELNPADSYLISDYHEDQVTHILLDAGKTGQGEKVIIPYLMEQGIHNIDYLILSHMHYDHFGGMIDILKDDRLHVDQLIYAPLPDETIRQSFNDENYTLWMKFKQLATQNRTSVKTIKKSDIGQTLPTDTQLSLEVISTPNEQIINEGSTLDLNEFNLVLKLNYHAFTALFPGDCGVLQANEILHSPQKEGIRSVTLFKAAHHGGDASTTSEFIEWCDPKIVMIPCNETVVEHRPSFIQNVHDFSRNGAKIFRADHCRRLELETDGFTVTCQAKYELYSETVTLSL